MQSGEFRSPTLKMLATVFGSIVLVSGAGEARSQAAQYAAKYVCGPVSSNVSTAGAGIVAPGAYYTSINVHNPNKDAVDIQKFFDVALPSEQQGGRMVGPVKASLKPLEAFEIECIDIIRHLDQNPKLFWKGFVTLQSSGPLDVVAVYTAAASASGPVVAFHTERVPKE
jgi:hypothetical protein